METKKQKGSVLHHTSSVTGHNQNNPIEYFEMVSGPELEYWWAAGVSRDPTPQGLDGGRVQYFNLVKFNDAPYEEAPDFDDERYVKWLENHPPRFFQIARYEEGKLTRDLNDPHAASIIEEIKKTCPAKGISWQRALEEMAGYK